MRMLFGRCSAVLSMAVALVDGLTPGDEGPAGFAGLVLGALGCILGARWLGAAALGLSAAKILVGLAGG